MKPKELNTLLLKLIPEVKDSFEEYTSWQDGLDTGCHSVFENVLLPFTIEALENDNEDLIKRIFKFINDMLISGDEYQEEVAQLSFLEPLKAEHEDEYRYSEIMLPETFKIFETLEY